MLAVEYEKNKELYQEYGMYKKEKINIINTKNKYSSKVNNGVRQGKTKGVSGVKGELLNYTLQSIIHESLSNIEKRHKGLLPQIHVLGAMMSNADISVCVNAKLSRYKADQYKLATEGMLQLKSEKQAMSDDDIITVDDLTDIQRICKIIRREGQQVPLITIVSERFKIRQPNYILNLRKYCTVHEIQVKEGEVDYNDIYFKKTFKNWVMVNDDGVVSTNPSEDVSNCIIVNKSGYSEEAIRYINKNNNIKTWNMKYTQITLKKGIYENTIALRIPYIKGREMINTSLIDNYDQILYNGRSCDVNQIGLSKESVIVKAKQTVRPVARMMSLNFIRKVWLRVLDKDNLNVSMVIIANKGTGKSKVLNELCNALKLTYGIDVGHLSSDTYGRWSYKYRRLSYDNEFKEVTYKMAKEMSDDEMVLSVYEVYANGLLLRYGIQTKEEYMKMSYKKRRVCQEELRCYILKHMEASNKYGEDKFYDSVLNSVTRPRFMILETHFMAANAIIGRTDTTCMLLTINDGRTACFERERGGAEQLLLYDTYNELNALSYTTIFPFELFEGFGVSSLISMEVGELVATC